MRRLGGAVVVFFSLLLASGCEEAPAAPETTMQFNVDPALIGEMQRFEAFNVQFAAPAGWAALPQEQVALVAAAVNQQGSATRPAGQATTGRTPEFAIEPLAVFARPEEGLWLIVSAAEVDEPASYEAALREQRGVVNATTYRVKGIDVHQYVLRPPRLMNLKLLLSAPERSEARRLQLDYVLPVETYEGHARALESSLGSMRPVGRKGA